MAHRTRAEHIASGLTVNVSDRGESIGKIADGLWIDTINEIQGLASDPWQFNGVHQSINGRFETDLDFVRLRLDLTRVEFEFYFEGAKHSGTAVPRFTGDQLVIVVQGKIDGSKDPYSHLIA